jgi:hypothetical protein
MVYLLKIFRFLKHCVMFIYFASLCVLSTSFCIKTQKMFYGFQDVSAILHFVVTILYVWNNLQHFIFFITVLQLSTSMYNVCKISQTFVKFVMFLYIFWITFCMFANILMIPNLVSECVHLPNVLFGFLYHFAWG